MSIYLNEPKKSISNNSENNSIDNNIEITPSVKETIIKFNTNEIETEHIKNKKQIYTSPVIIRTPNTKTDIIIQKIYSNRRNIIKNINTKNKDKYNETNLSQNNNNSKILSDKDIQFKQSQLTKSSLTSSSNLLYPSSTVVNSEPLSPKVIMDVDTDIHDNNNLYIKSTCSRDINTNDKNLEYEKSSPSTDISSVTSDNSQENCSFSYPHEKKKRKYHKNIKIRKYTKNSENQITNNDIIFENQHEYSTNSKKNTPLSSPRNENIELWNETIENYYMEFQKICKDESKKYKCLSKYNEIISKILKFLLLVSGCFTFTLSITIPNSLIMTTTTTISSILTATITSIIGFFQFEKTSEIQYNIYKELDKLYSIISLELLKPTYIRSDPYELILLIQNRRDELLKTLHKK